MISRQFLHLPHGSKFCGSRQFRALAKILATDVFPQPLEPENKYACPTLDFEMELRIIFTAAFCPQTL